MPVSVDHSVLAEDPGLTRDAAMTATHTGDWEKAYLLWLALLDDAPANWEALYRSAEAAFWRNDLANCLALARRASEQRPADVRPLILQGRILRKNRDPETAVSVWARLTELDPGFYEAYLRLAECHLALGHCAEALPAISEALSLDPLNTAAYPVAGRILRGLDEEPADAAIASWVNLLEQAEPGAADTLLAQIGRYRARRRRRPLHTHNVEPIDRASVDQPPSTEKVRPEAMARRLHAAEQWEAAAAVWQELADGSATKFEPQFRLGQALMRLGRPGEALDCFRTAQRLRPDHEQNIVDHASCLVALDRRADAIDLWRRVLDERFDDVNLAVRCAAFLTDLGEHDLARKIGAGAFRRIRARDRNALRLAKTMADLGAWRESIAGLRPLMPRGDEVLDATALTLIARYATALQNNGQINDALDVLALTEASSAPDRRVIRLHARMLVDMNRLADARQFMQRVRDRFGFEKWVWLESMVAAKSLGDYHEVKPLFAQACAYLLPELDDWMDLAEVCDVAEARGEIVARIAEAKTGDVDQINRLATLAFGRGDFRLALRLAQRASAIDPENRPAREMLVDTARYIALFEDNGLSLDETALPDSAFELLARLLAKNPRANEARPNTIALVNSSLAAGGAERQVVATLLGFARREDPDYELHLICRDLSPESGRDRNLPAIRDTKVNVVDLAISGVTERPEHIGDLEWRAIQLLAPEHRTELLQLVNEFVRIRPQFVHLWQDRTNLIGGFAAALAGVPSIVLSTRSTRPSSRKRFRPYMHRAYKALMALPNVLLSNNSLAGAEDYADWLSIPAESIQVVYNGFDFERLATDDDRRTAPERKRSLGIPDDALVVGAVFRISAVKRPLLWVDIAAEVAAALPDVHFVIAGDGPLMPEMRERAASHGIADRFHFLGHVNSGPWYLIMDVLLLTSETEGLPNVVIEAQALGAAVVSTKVGGVLEIIEEGVTGHAVATDDPAPLAEKLIRILSDAEWRGIARSKGIGQALARFGMDSMIDRTLAVYRMALAARASDALPSGEPPTDLDAFTPIPEIADNISEIEQTIGSDAAFENGAPSAAASDEAPVSMAAPAPDRLPDKWSDLHVAAEALFAAGHLHQAHEAFAELHRRDPRNVEALRWLARTRRGLDLHQPSIEAWRKLLRLSPGDMEAHIRIPEAFVNLNLPREARDLSGKALAAGLRDIRLMRLHAQTLRACDDNARALAAWRDILEEDPDDFEALFRAGELAFLDGRFDFAETLLERAVARSVRDARPTIMLARHYVWQNRFADARRLLHKWLREHPRDIAIWGAALDLVRVAGKHGLERRVWRRIERRLAAKTEDTVLLAQLMASNGYPQTATALFTRLLDHPEIRGEAAHELIALRLAAGRVADAAGILQDHRDAIAAKMPAVARGDAHAVQRCTDFLRTTFARDERSDYRDAFIASVRRAVDSRSSRRSPARKGVILHVLNSLAAGGTERQCVSVATHQARLLPDHEVCVLRIDPRGSGRAVFYLPALKQARVKTATLSEYAATVGDIARELPFLSEAPPLLRSQVNCREIATLLGAMRAIRPQVVHAWTPQCCMHAGIAGLLFGADRIVLRGGSVAPDQRGDVTEAEAAQTDWIGKAVRFVLGYPTAVLANNCHANLASWTRWLDLDADSARRTVVIKNIFDGAAFGSTHPPDSGAPPPIRPSGASFVVGSVMRLEREKDPELWAEVVTEAAARFSDWHFVLVGDGRMRLAVERQLAGRGLLDRATLAGAIHEGLADYYAAFDALLLTSRFEGVPNVLIEAQHFGVPTVATDVGGVREALDHGSTGFAVASRDPAELVNTLQAIYENNARGASAAEACRRFVRRFEPAAVIEDLLRIYGGAGPAAKKADLHGL